MLVVICHHLMMDVGYGLVLSWLVIQTTHGSLMEELVALAITIKIVIIIVVQSLPSNLDLISQGAAPCE